MGEGRYSGGSPEANQRLTVREAADQLGISEAAVRNRIKRGTLQAERESGRVYVLLAGAVHRDEPTDTPADESALVAVLREQLAAEREANRENRRIIAGLIERIPELEAPPEPQDTPSEARPRSDEGIGTQEPEEATERRPFWRRIFGG